MTDQESSELLLLEIAKYGNRMRGRLAGAIEAVGLDSKREKAIIDMLKGISYDQERSLKEVIFKSEREQ
jgi:hypothetical protein